MFKRRNYRIQAVADLTGVPSATLRAWERRYGIPKPSRTESRYRLYSESDIQQVRRMKELIGAGMSPAEASQLVAAEPAAGQVQPEHTDAYEAAADRLVAAARRMDPAQIQGEVRFALTLGDAVSIVERVFCPAMETVGRDWEQGVISVAHEHLVAEIVTLATRDLLRLMPVGRGSGPTALLACFADEEHVLPLYAAAFRFVELGIYPHVLGQRTPPNALQTAVKELAPDLVGLSVTIAPDAARARRQLTGYAEASQGRPWLVGGAASESLQTEVQRLGGRVVYGTGHEVRNGIAAVLRSA